MTEKDFIKTRVPFVILDGEVIFDEERALKTKDWATNVLHMSEEDFEDCIYGGIFENRITFSHTSDYEPADMSKVPLSAFLDILCKHKQLFGNAEVTVINGQHVGDVGVQWEPVVVLGQIVYK